MPTCPKCKIEIPDSGDGHQKCYNCGFSFMDVSDFVKGLSTKNIGYLISEIAKSKIIIQDLNEKLFKNNEEIKFLTNLVNPEENALELDSHDIGVIMWCCKKVRYFLTHDQYHRKKQIKNLFWKIKNAGYQ